ncbi:MAG: hypothetical protein DIU82_02545, partial [Bacillota bacterium]
MDLEPGTTRLYRCALCGADTPHRIRGRRGNRYAVVCTNCSGGALVGGDDLWLYQLRYKHPSPPRQGVVSIFGGRAFLQKTRDNSDTSEPRDKTTQC